MPQSLAVTLNVILFATGCFLFWLFLFHLDIANGWIALGVPMAVIATSLFMMLWSFSDNYYNVTSGTVVDTSFTKAHMTPTTTTFTGKTVVVIPGHYVDDDWALLVRDNRGKEGWLHFGKDIFNEFPVGSHYPNDEQLNHR